MSSRDEMRGGLRPVGGSGKTPEYGRYVESLGETRGGKSRIRAAAGFRGLVLACLLPVGLALTSGTASATLIIEYLIVGKFGNTKPVSTLGVDS